MHWQMRHWERTQNNHMANFDLIASFLMLSALLLGILYLYWALSAYIYRSIHTAFRLPLAPFIAPGVALHETSHLVAALALLRRIHSVKLYTFNHNSGELGHVTYSHSRKTPLTTLFDSIIGLAPIIGALFSIYWLSIWLVPEATSLALKEFYTLFIHYVPYDVRYWNYTYEIYNALFYRFAMEWQTYVWLFLILSIAHGAIPSRQDIKMALPGFAFLIFCIAFFSLFSNAISSYILKETNLWMNIAASTLTALGVPIVILAMAIAILRIILRK